MSEPSFTFATHPNKPNHRSNTRSRVLHVKRDEKTTLCKMVVTETPFSISDGYGREADPNEYDQCQNCVNIYKKESGRTKEAQP